MNADLLRAPTAPASARSVGSLAGAGPRSSERRSQAGYTMVELVVGLGLAGLILMLLASLLQSVLGVQSRVEKQMDTQRSGFVAIDEMSLKIRQAGLNLDPAIGEEAFPPLPEGAGGNWANAVAIQYRPGGGEIRQIAYYVANGQLWEDRGDGNPLPLAVENVKVLRLDVSYYSEHYVELLPTNLSQPKQRALVRRVGITLLLDRDGDGTEEYRLSTSVPVMNIHLTP